VKVFTDFVKKPDFLQRNSFLRSLFLFTIFISLLS